MKITVKQLKMLIKEAVMEIGQQPPHGGSSVLSPEEISNIIHDVLASYQGNPDDAVEAFNKALKKVEPHGVGTGEAPEGLAAMHESALRQLVRGIVKEAATKKQGTRKKK